MLLRFVQTSLCRSNWNGPVNFNKPLMRFTSNTAPNNVKSKVNLERKLRARSVAYYATAAAVLTVGLSYAAVPLYRMFCQVIWPKFI